MKKYFLIFLMIGSLGVGCSQIAHADSATENTNLSYVPLEPILDLQGATSADIPTLLKSVFRILFSLGALFAVGRLVLGGILYMTSVSAGSKDKARKWASSSVFGLLILAGSYLILYTINPDLIKLNFTVPTTGRFVSPTTSTNSTPFPAQQHNTGTVAINSTLRINENSTTKAKELSDFTAKCENIGGAVTSLSAAGASYTLYTCKGTPADRQDAAGSLVLNIKTGKPLTSEILASDDLDVRVQKTQEFLAKCTELGGSVFWLTGPDNGSTNLGSSVGMCRKK